MWRSIIFCSQVNYTMLKLTSRRTRGRHPATWQNQGENLLEINTERERERSCCKFTFCPACFHTPHHPLIWSRLDFCIFFSFWRWLFINSIHTFIFFRLYGSPSKKQLVRTKILLSSILLEILFCSFYLNSTLTNCVLHGLLFKVFWFQNLLEIKVLHFHSFKFRNSCVIIVFGMVSIVWYKTVVRSSYNIWCYEFFSFYDS